MEDLSGDYCYYGPDFNVRSFRRTVDEIPFVDVPALGTPSLVSVQATKENVVINFTRPDGTRENRVFDSVKAGAVWRDHALVISSENGWSMSWRSPPSQFTWNFGGLRESRLARQEDGRLVMSDSFRRNSYTEENGGQNPLFHLEEYSVAVILDPAIRGCDADTKARPRQRWFGRGPDLRAEACAAQLKETLAAILVEQGEAPETAEGLAAETLDSFFRGSESRYFSVWSPSRARYSFEVAKKATGGVLRLYERERASGRTLNTLWYIAKRPLPDCDCND